MPQQRGPLDDLLLKLAAKVNSYQVLKEQNYTRPPHWYEKAGLFRSEIRVNLFGNPALHEFRTSEITAVFDNDMFSTGWILTALLEANLYGRGAPEFDPSRLTLALEAIGQYNNRNSRDPEHSILRTFWPQQYNQTNQLWFQQPINIFHVAKFLEEIPFNQIEAFLHKFHLDKFIPIIDGEFKKYYGVLNLFF